MRVSSVLPSTEGCDPKPETTLLPPIQIRDAVRWVLWRLQPRGRGQKTCKPPYQIDGKTPASVSDQGTWASYAQCRHALQNGASHCNGLGIVLPPGMVGIDLDLLASCAEAREVIKHFRGTFCEVSPSGNLRIFVLGKLTRSGKRGHAEIYAEDSPRYLTFTGNHIPGTATEITNQQAAIDWFYEKYFDNREEPAERAEKPEQPQHKLDDDEITARASSAKNGAMFQDLFEGNWSDYTSPSEADLALCGILAFWTKDPAQIDRIFRRSGLFRKKWDEARDGETYGIRTIAKAIQNTPATYTPEKQTNSTKKPPRDRNKSTKLQQAMIAVATSFRDLAYDTFRRRNVGTDEFIESSAMLAIEKECGFTPSPQVVRAAITQVAINRRFDSLLDFVNALPPWDGTERLNTWLQVYLGATDNPKYLARAGRYFLIGMLARALRPGCKMDNVLNLEGPQGIGKSTACEILGSGFFGRPSTAEFGSRDHVNEIQGKWLIEFPDLGNLSKADKRKLKSFFSEQEDEFTKKYISEPTKAPRRCVFIITDNPDPDGFSWLEDPTGARRIWAVTCGALDLESLTRDQQQLFAEARKALEAGEPWWPSGEEQQGLFGPRQEAFLGVDEWFEPVGLALEQAKTDSGYPDRHPDFWVTTDSILDVMGIPVAQRTRAATMKVGKNLRALGLVSRWRRDGGRAYSYPT